MIQNGTVALGYARRGWAVLPLHQPARHGCSCAHDDCTSPAKHPKVSGGLHSASLSPDAIRRWWRRWPAANVGIRTGRESGLVVIDIDPRHGGNEALASLQDDHGPIDGWRIKTGSGGSHLWFAHPGGTLRNSAGRLGDGLDVRGDGGYVVAPPSRHMSGGTYRWADARGALPALPEWLRERLVDRPPVVGRTHVPERSSGDAWARTALVLETDRVSRAPDGRRNDTLNSAAYSLGQISGAGLLDDRVVVESLSAAAISAGLTSREALRTIESGLAAGMRSPRGPSPPTRAHSIREVAVEPIEIDL